MPFNSVQVFGATSGTVTIAGGTTAAPPTQVYVGCNVRVRGTVPACCTQNEML